MFTPTRHEIRLPTRGGQAKGPGHNNSRYREDDPDQSKGIKLYRCKDAAQGYHRGAGFHEQTKHQRSAFTATSHENPMRVMVFPAKRRQPSM